MAKVEKRTPTLSKERQRELLREMLLIRRFEEKVEERFRAGELPGFLHVAIGQEACAVGVCRALEEGDVIASTHRAHGHTLAKGTHPNEVMAELYGKLEGTSHGYGGLPGFRFRASRSFGYGTSPEMSRRCFERLDAERIGGTVRVLYALSDTHPVGTQGPVFRVEGRAV